jgi:pyruvate formate lyase activating enzyme
MSIGGVVRTSFVDYPGKIATTIFLSSCNFSSPFCQNPELVLDSGLIYESFDDILGYLSKASPAIVDAVCISGGEPTLDPELSHYISEIKKLGLLVKLDTNGSNPGLIRNLPLDYLAMDIKTSPEKYSLITAIPDISSKILDSVHYLLASAPFAYEFRTTLVPGLVTEADIHAIGSLIKGSEKWFLQHFRNTVTLDESCRSLQPYPPHQEEQLLSVARQYVSGAVLR